MGTEIFLLTHREILIPHRASKTGEALYEMLRGRVSTKVREIVLHIKTGVCGATNVQNSHMFSQVHMQREDAKTAVRNNNSWMWFNVCLSFSKM